MLQLCENVPSTIVQQQQLIVDIRQKTVVIVVVALTVLNVLIVVLVVIAQTAVKVVTLVQVTVMSTKKPVHINEPLDDNRDSSQSSGKSDNKYSKVKYYKKSWNQVKKYLFSCTVQNNYFLKNPASLRQSISRPMQIVSQLPRSF